MAADVFRQRKRKIIVLEVREKEYLQFIDQKGFTMKIKISVLMQK